MSKYKNVLVSQIQERRLQEKRQSDLKQKHKIDQKENVLIVEKSNVFKFLITTIGVIIKCAAQVMIVMLAAIGLMTIIYPELREPFLTLLLNIKAQFFSMVR